MNKKKINSRKVKLTVLQVSVDNQLAPVALALWLHVHHAKTVWQKRSLYPMAGYK
jgi:hypothetical protein